jgi:hypothetical protein
MERTKKRRATDFTVASQVKILKKEKLNRQCLWGRCFVKNKEHGRLSFLFPLFIFSRCYWCPGGSHKANWRKLYIYMYAPPLNRYSDDYNLFSKRAHFPTSWEYFSQKKIERPNQVINMLPAAMHGTHFRFGVGFVYTGPREQLSSRERECIVVLLFTTF